MNTKESIEKIGNRLEQMKIFKDKIDKDVASLLEI